MWGSVSVPHLQLHLVVKYSYFILSYWWKNLNEAQFLTEPANLNVHEMDEHKVLKEGSSLCMLWKNLSIQNESLWRLVLLCILSLKKVCYYVDECLKLNSVSFPEEHVSVFLSFCFCFLLNFCCFHPACLLTQGCVCGFDEERHSC